MVRQVLQIRVSLKYLKRRTLLNRTKKKRSKVRRKKNTNITMMIKTITTKTRITTTMKIKNTIMTIRIVTTKSTTTTIRSIIITMVKKVSKRTSTLGFSLLMSLRLQKFLLKLPLALIRITFRSTRKMSRSIP